jgi:hypothetical protein
MMSFTILITFSAQLVELGCAIQASMRTLVESVRHRQHRVFVRDYVGAYAELVAKISPQNFPSKFPPVCSLDVTPLWSLRFFV